MFLSLLILDDAQGAPGFKTELPETRIGDTLRLRKRLARRHGGRHEVLDLIGEFKITSRTLDASASPITQVLHIASTGLAPTWKSVKAPAKRRLGPSQFPRTPIE